MSKIPKRHELFLIWKYRSILAMEAEIRLALQIGALKNRAARIDCVRCNGRSCGWSNSIRANSLLLIILWIFNRKSKVHTKGVWEKLLKSVLKMNCIYGSAYKLSCEVRRKWFTCWGLDCQNTRSSSTTYAEEMKKSCCVASHSCRRIKESNRRRRCCVNGNYSHVR